MFQKRLNVSCALHGDVIPYQPTGGKGTNTEGISFLERKWRPYHAFYSSPPKEILVRFVLAFLEGCLCKSWNRGILRLAGYRVGAILSSQDPSLCNQLEHKTYSQGLCLLCLFSGQPMLFFSQPGFQEALLSAK